MSKSKLHYAVLPFIFVAAMAHATTYYVSASGSGTACTQVAPCSSISAAYAKAVAGDIVQVGAGTYNETVTLNRSGASGNKIIVRGHDGSGCPIVRVADVNHPTGQNPAPTVTVVGGFRFSANYITLDCFRVVPGSGDRIVGSGGTHDNDIVNNEVDGSSSSTPGGGINFDGVDSITEPNYARSYTMTGNYIHGVSGNFIVCSNCLFQENEVRSLQGDEPGSDHDYVDLWGTNTIIRHNYMHDNTSNACMSYDCHMDCVQTWNTVGNGTEVSKNITIDRNVCFNHHEGVIVQDNAGNGDVANWTVTNNVFAFGPWDDGSGHPAVAGSVHPWCWVFEDGNLGTANEFLNNTCIDGSMGFRNASGSAVISNNIWYGSNSTPYQNGGGTSVTGQSNLYYSNPGSVSAVFPKDIVNINPQFISLGSGYSAMRCIGCDFSLSSSSRAIDAGSNMSPLVTSDLRGVSRPQGASYDIGAYEEPSGVTATPAAPTGLTAQVH